MSITEKVAFLKGLMEGADIDADKKEGKLFTAIIDVLDEIAAELSDVDEDLLELSAYVEELDEDLGELEEFTYEIYEDEDGHCGCGCGCDDDDDDCCCDDEIEVTSPACDAEICFELDEIDDEGHIECPSCGETLEFEIEELEDDEDDEDLKF